MSFLDNLNPKKSKSLKQLGSVNEMIEDFKWTARKCEYIANSFLFLAAVVIFLGGLFYAYPHTAEEWLGLNEPKQVQQDFDPTWGEKTIKGYTELRQILAIEAVSKKFGIVILLLFLVQVLVRTYRYNKRIANFYNSRAQSLEFVEMKYKGLNDEGKYPEADVQLTQFLRSLKFFNTDSIDIGVPRSPAATVADAFKK